jgi:hypothetical protein
MDKTALHRIEAEVKPSELTPVSAPGKNFSLYKEYSNGGRIEVMDGYIGKSDHNHLRTIARQWAMEGKVVQITTDIHFKDSVYQQVFGELKGTKYERKCPDLIVDGEFYEFESYNPPFNGNKISRMLSKGLKQSSRIIINNSKGTSDKHIIASIHNRIRDKKFKHNIDEVWAYEKGRVRLLFKKG